MNRWYLPILLVSLAVQAGPKVTHFKSVYFLNLTGKGKVFIQHQSKPGLRVTQVRSTRNKARLDAHNHSLLIHVPKGSQVQVYLGNIERVNVNDQVQMRADHVGLHHLWIGLGNHRNHRLVHIKGLQSIDHHGAGSVRVLWLESQLLSLCLSDHAKLDLVGHANRMLAKLSGQAQLQAPFFRVNHIWVRAQDQALAKLFPLKFLHAYAKNHSQLTYYHYLPQGMVYRDSYDFANILYVAPDHLRA